MRKKTLTDLAVFGGQPAFGEILHVGQPNVGNSEKLLERINELLDRRWLTNHGPYVQEFEQRLVERLGVRNCIAMCNGTVALEIAARALSLAGEVIVPAFTFVATAHCLQWQQITPIFCDVDPRTHNLDPRQVERMITPQTTGIIGVHLWGQPCNVEALTYIADRHDLILVFDAAHAFGCSHDGRMIGNFGQCEVFSFHATKFFNTFEGGAVTTNDDELATKIRLMHNFGFAGLDSVIYIGTNGKMSEVSAAMGLTGLESLDDFIAVNYQNYQHYQEGLDQLQGLCMLTYDEAEKQNYQYIVVEIDERQAGISRDCLVEILHAENVRARRYFYPGCHQMEPYRSLFPHAGLLLPETESLVQRVMTLPTGTGVSEAEIDCICQIIRFAISNGPEISHRLAG
ncbi:MAG: aminotransferase class I/II-fold pyridoxal phosphate-dependent enzyme [Anaerolineae bacterium]|nr:aminotransferase class I/II-fold pyridoxal phosphate-dependent enzyme [Anaerolineae bacterium]